MSRLIAVSVAVCFLTLPSACSDTSGPDATPIVPGIVAASIVAVSPVELTATVGTHVPTPPSVLVKEANGTPIDGALVTFSITDGAGSLSNATTRTNSSGVASVSSWQIGTSAGLNVVSASISPLPTVRFAVIGIAGPATTILKADGDNQVAARGSAVPIKPQVKVTDSYNNAVKGVAVSFAIEAGGGYLAGENVTSDSLGIATLESWVLGATGGQILVATIAGLTPVKFLATTFDLAEECSPVDLPAEQAPVTTELRVQGCQGADGRFVDYYLVRLASAGTWHFKLASADFDTRLELRSATGIPIASDRASSLTTNSEIRAMLPPGNFLLIVTSVDAEAVGRYAISYGPGSSDIGGCEVSIARGISTAQNFTGGKCPQIGDRYVDRYRVYLKAGSAVSIILDDYSLSDNHMEIQDDAGHPVAPAVVKDYVRSTIDYAARVDGYYVISLWVAERYELSVQ